MRQNAQSVAPTLKGVKCPWAWALYRKKWPKSGSKPCCEWKL